MAAQLAMLQGVELPGKSLHWAKGSSDFFVVQSSMVSPIFLVGELQGHLVGH
jgi:hypothetical protein